ncbi:c-type cytochrome biogenesis protein CcmI [Pararhizobium mangrovi]|uniref:C-type cytochrome biogenesis protein CcmI n=1 Tax=Pararhizobium mangrovi TaxID=2590452 RepID=A0A506UHI5_9HYPH|nr:c-type cytochrome biogenesis protein CcmI [Pararhizobium mangrovi]TPW32772.1 c-type cytochrome biogenesis protein CcmI [Pararhizobium mangrovi]
MTFWLVSAGLTAAVVLAIVFPIVRSVRKGSGGAENDVAAHDVAVYRDQLSEIERDLASGTIGPTEAESARAEVGRRLLKAAREEARPERPEDGGTGGIVPFRLAIIGLVVVLVPLVGVASYARLGNPDLADEPLSARLAGPDGSPEMAGLIGKAEARLRANPEDGRGWDVLAPIYTRVGRIQDATIAWRNAIRLLGPTARRQAGLGETIVMENGGGMTDEAKAAFQAALQADPGDAKARFFLALGEAQDGKYDTALADFRALETDSADDAPWLPAVRQQIAALAGAQAAGDGDAVAAAAGVPEGEGDGTVPGGPNAAEIAAASKMSGGDRTAMIRGMVSRLDAKLADAPEDAEGWRRLVRSYMVLGDPAKARDALARALKVFPADSDHGRQLVAFAGRIGVPDADGIIGSTEAGSSSDVPATPQNGKVVQ